MTATPPAPASRNRRPLPPPRADRLAARTLVVLVDDGFGALRSHFGLVAGTGVLFLLPIVAVVALIGEGEPTPGLITSGSWVAGIVSVFGFSLACALMGVPLSRAVALLAAGEPPTWRRCYGAGWRAWTAVAVAWLLVLPLRGLSLLMLGLPFVAVTALLIPLSPVIALEGRGPLAGLRRTLQVGGGGFGRGLGLVLVQAIIGWTVSGALLITPALLLDGVGERGQRVAANLAQLGLGVLLCPTAAWTAARFYLDERARREALDLHTALTEWQAAGRPRPVLDATLAQREAG